jgi:cytoskeletal protein CcmA (bactofilin family)
MTKSVFSTDLRVTGDVTSKGDLDIHGHVEGSVDVKGLTVAPGASVTGSVRAAATDIAGHVDGQVDSDRVSIMPTGALEGTVTYRTLSVMVGGGLNARCAPVAGASAESAGSDANPAPAPRLGGQAGRPRKGGTSARRPIDAPA